MFLLLDPEHAPTDTWFNMLRTWLVQKKYEEAMSDEHPQIQEFDPVS